MLLEEMPLIDFYSQVEQSQQLANHQMINSSAHSAQIPNESGQYRETPNESRKQRIKVKDQGNYLHIPQVLQISQL